MIENGATPLACCCDCSLVCISSSVNSTVCSSSLLSSLLAFPPLTLSSFSSISLRPIKSAYADAFTELVINKPDAK